MKEHVQAPESVVLQRAGAQQASRPRTAVRVRVAVFALAALLPVVVGQLDRDLLPPDDLREAEVAREMWATGDHVVPQLSGRPFVEKPPGFQAVVASAYTLAGGPSTAAARAVTAGFALLTLLAVFTLARSALGVEGAGLAAAILALSSRFCRTAHTVLLDNALTAAFAFSLLFTWRGLREQDARAKERAYTAAAFSLGISFLFKGFVGPALFGAGALTYLAATRRFAELRHALRPLPIAAFLLPVLCWLVPFVSRADPTLVHAFFIENHWGRAALGYASNVRPFYFYASDLWFAFAPAVALLPFAAWSAFRKRRTPGGETAFFFLAFAAGPLLLLSLSKAKDSVYALPVYPALALLVATWCEEKLRAGGRGALPGVFAAALVAAGAAATAIVATVSFGGMTGRAALAASVLASLAGGALWFVRRGHSRSLAAAGAAMAALGWVLWFSGPLEAHEVARRSIRGPIEAALAVAGDRTVLLLNPSDGLRGASSFWRNRTAEEAPDAESFARRLLEDRKVVGLFHMTVRDHFLDYVHAAFSQLGAEPVVEAAVPAGEDRVVLLWGARSRSGVPERYASSHSR